MSVSFEIYCDIGDTNQMDSFSIKELKSPIDKNVEDYENRLALLKSISNVFEKRLSYDPTSQDAFGLGKQDPMEYLMNRATELTNPQKWSTYLWSYLYTTKYQTDVLNVYRDICRLYDGIKFDHAGEYAFSDDSTKKNASNLISANSVSIPLHELNHKV